MIVSEGVKIASPAHDHQVRSLNNMEYGVLYPMSCFSNFMLSRGRSLIDALGKDPAAPRATKTKRGKCYDIKRIKDYLQSYGEGFIAQSDEVNGKISALREADQNDLNKVIARQSEEMKRIKAAHEVKLEQFSRDFINQYAFDITKACMEVCGVYFLRKDNRIVYVGQSVNVYARIPTHAKKKDFDSVDFLPCEGDRLDELEGFFIRLLRPELNGYEYDVVKGSPNSSLWGDVVNLPLGALLVDAPEVMS